MGIANKKVTSFEDMVEEDAPTTTLPENAVEQGITAPASTGPEDTDNPQPSVE